MDAESDRMAAGSGGAVGRVGERAVARVAAGARRLAPRRGAGRKGLLLGAAAALAAAAVWNHTRARRAERAHPPLGRFLEVDGVRLHHVDRGRGRPVVLLHGNGTMLEDFATSGLLDLVAERHRVIAFDRPGYGYSERPRGRAWTAEAQARLLHAALRRLGVAKPVVVGHSWGCFVALAMALQEPREVGALVLLSGYYFPTFRGDVPLLSPPAIPVLGDLMRHTVSPLIGRLVWDPMLRRLFSPAPVAPGIAGLEEMALRPAQLRASAAESALMIPTAAALRPHYHELAVPVVIAAGAGDRHVDTGRQSARLHRELPDSDFHVMTEVGHMVHHTRPEGVLTAIEQAFRRLEEAQSEAR